MFQRLLCWTPSFMKFSAKLNSKEQTRFLHALKTAFRVQKAVHSDTNVYLNLSPSTFEFIIQSVCRDRLDARLSYPTTAFTEFRCESRRNNLLCMDICMADLLACLKSVGYADVLHIRLDKRDNRPILAFEYMNTHEKVYHATHIHLCHEDAQASYADYLGLTPDLAFVVPKMSLWQQLCTKIHHLGHQFVRIWGQPLENEGCQVTLRTQGGTATMVESTMVLARQSGDRGVGCAINAKKLANLTTCANLVSESALVRVFEDSLLLLTCSGSGGLDLQLFCAVTSEG